MIAEAVKRSLPEKARSVTVDLTQIRWTDPVKRLRYIYLTPRVAQIALIDYDTGIRPEPFQFVLKTPTQIVRSRPGEHQRAAERNPNGKPAWRERGKAMNNARRRAERAVNLDEPFAVSEERRAEVMRAFDDPEANLGYAVSLPAEHGSVQSVTVVVGGRPPPRGNLGKIRRFGLRQLRE